ncbi:hypothetical protein G7046_g849 [Stylonectria norvegica]|nr:hypothetical protein G7046_g849 [Stylonectria norvegica]
MEPIPTTMKAWVATRPIGVNNGLELHSDWPTPGTPTGSDIMVKILCAATNPLDLVMIGMRVPFHRKYIPSADFSGIVVQTGPAISSSNQNVHVGMTVCGSLPTTRIILSGGALAEYLVLPAHMVSQKPDGLDDSAGAGLMGVTGQTAVILLRAADLREGDRVLIKGASGGVGTILLQVLRATGIHVTAISSGRNEDLVRRLGAQEVIDYTIHDSLYEYLRNTFRTQPFDAILDCVGDDKLYKESTEYLKPGKGFYTIGSDPLIGLKYKILPFMMGGGPRPFHAVMNSPSGRGAKEAAEWFNKGLVKEVPIDSTFEMGEADKALKYLASKRARGKIIIKV